jgi:hypothetical protein
MVTNELSNESQCVLDIETVMNERAMDWYATKQYKAPSHYKDDQKILDYIDNARAKDMNNAALEWNTAKVFTFAVSDVNGDNFVFVYSLDEREVLARLSKLVGEKTVWSKSGKVFDYPLLIGRYIANKMVLPSFLKDRVRQKDVDDFFGFSQSSPQRGSLERYAHGLGVDGKTGSYKLAQTTYDLMVTGQEHMEELTQLRDYNIQDAVIVREMVRRYNA